MITNYCNLKCPYCFANDFIQTKKKNITLDELNNILNWIDSNEQIGLIGGEPTLHPHFNSILKICKKRNSKTVIFSNGINLKKYLKYLDDNLECLVNINSPKEMGENNWIKIKDTINYAIEINKDKYISLSFNLYEELDDWSFLFELTKTKKLKYIRVSCVAPYKNYDKENYYNNMKNKFLNFVKDCHNHGVKIKLDCNHIPNCYFTAEELKYLQYKVFGYFSKCEPVIDISSDFKATCCFGSYELIDLKNFNNYQELKTYFKNEMNQKIIKNNTGKCKTCDLLNNKECQGGCFGFIK